ncbi:hemolysin family protein [Gleimia sp. 6138-11-ORH1]|uniref:hemolysin family protein n=1 Tax=Gleimia sp. 6138-11-ORH1 TaxID=2973937 RepID=UPI00216A51FC|nr:hemolysin family protein [Gleimia sp. 6138-11-ORH1]MCS4484194.1 hemolysin family protein [Gleimia sp. 6138-11-ORH1]
MESTPLGFLIVLSLIAMVVAGISVAAESALQRLSHAAVDDLVEASLPRAKRLEILIDDRKRTIVTTRSWRLIFQTLFTIATTLIVASFFTAWWAILGIAIIINWLLVAVFIAFIPNRISLRNPEAVALWLTPLLETYLAGSKMWDPLVRIFARFLPASEQTVAEARAEMVEEMREVVDEVGETTGFEEEDRVMLRSVFELGHTLVREVMVPRTEMVTMGAEASLDEALDLFVTSGYSRIPVIEDDIDDIVGIIYFKDVVSRLRRRPEDRQIPVRNACREPKFVPEMVLADDQLRQMQADRVHLVLVVDEYGGVAGLITIEDLLEEIVGELTDEHDRNVMEPEEISPGVWRVPARFSLWELGELLGIELRDEDVDSVGGLLGKVLGKVPLPGDHGETEEIEITADETIGRRQLGTVVAKLRTPKTEPESTEESKNRLESETN